jgi:hypothetical protein
MTDPCSQASQLVHLVIAFGSVVTSCFAVFLAHRRKVADRERREFYQVMSQQLGGEDWQVLRTRERANRANGR